MLLPRMRPAALAALLVLLAAPAALAHGGEPHPAGAALAAPPPGDATAARLAELRAAVIRSAEPEEHRRDLAAAWADPSGAFTELDVHASVALGVAGLAVAYALLVGPLRRRFGWGQPVGARRVAWFATSLVVLFGTLNGPLHHLADYYLFTGHMLQHMILQLLFPCAFLAGLPGWLFAPLLRRRAILRLGRTLTHPVTAYAIYTAILIGWHFPFAYELAMRNHDVHIAQHLFFMVSGVIVFWPVVGPAPELPRLTYFWQIGYLFVMQLPMIALGAFLTLAEHVLYPFYEAAPRVLPALGPLEDQQLGGLLMWLPGHLVLWIPMAVIFVRWYRAQSDDATGLPVPRVVPLRR